MRLGDLDALIEVFRGEEGAKALDHFPLRLIKVKQIVDNAPTIDAIPVEWLRNVHKNWILTRDDMKFMDWLIERWQQEQEAQDDPKV